jgi:cytochrome P450
MIKDNLTFMNKRVRQLAPGPQEFPQLWDDQLGLLVEAAQQYGDVVCLDPESHQIYLVSHPDQIRHVLQDNYRNYRRDADTFKLMVGDGLFVSEGELWLRQRRLMQPAFHKRQIAALVAGMVETTTDMLAQWQSSFTPGTPVDILEEMMALTMRIIFKTMFGVSVGAEVEAAARAMAIGQEYVYYRGWEYNEEQSNPEQERFQGAMATLDRMVYRIIDERRQSEAGSDLLSMLLQARDAETNEGMSEKQLRDEIITIFGAGRDTTAIALAWSWYLLAQHPEVEQRLRAELATVLAGRPPGFEDLSKLPYTQQVIEEAMRLYPPAWITTRRSIGPDELGGYDIPANSEIFLCPYITHRRPDMWEEPERFDPDRFTAERSANRPRFAYFPFGGGPRVCIGNTFALVEAQIIMAMIAQAYQFRLLPESQVRPQALITLQPQGLAMSLYPV